MIDYEEIANPLIIVHQPDGPGSSVRTLICNDERKPLTYQQFGLVICDVVRHVARAFEVADIAVYEWVRKEFENPTTEVETLYRSPRGYA